MELSKKEKMIKYAGLLYGVTFIFTALVFFVAAPDVLIGIINSFSEKVFPSLPPYPAGENKFWISMTVSMMSGLTAASLLIYFDVRKYFVMAIPVSIMKFTSALFGAGFFAVGFLAGVREWTALANLIIFLTDFPLGLFMVFLYFRVSREKTMTSQIFVKTGKREANGSAW